MLLMDDTGKAESRWNLHFSMNSDHSLEVAHALLIDGVLEQIFSHHPTGEIDLDRPFTTHISKFVKKIEQKLFVHEDDIVLFNRSCLYEQCVFNAILDFVSIGSGTSVSLYLVSAADLTTMFTDLNVGQLNAFSMGLPLWVARALDQPMDRGRYSGSDRSKSLGRAVRAWALLCERIILHSFEKAIRDGHEGTRRLGDVEQNASDLVQYALGEITPRESATRGIPVSRFDEIGMLPLSLQDIYKKHKSSLFGKTLSPRGRMIRRNGMPLKRPKVTKSLGYSSGKSQFFRGSLEQISIELRRDIEHFGKLNPQAQFDHNAYVAWSLDVLRLLRLTFSVSVSLDQKRLATRLELAGAPDHGARFAAVEHFAGQRRNRAAGHGRRAVKLSDSDVMGIQDAAMVAFIGGVHPGPFQEHHLYAEMDLAALFKLSAWLGRFYRRRSVNLTPELAGCYLHLHSLCTEQQQDEQVAQLEMAKSTVLSFLPPAGLGRLRDAVELAFGDNVDRELVAIDPGYGRTMRRKPRESRKLLRLQKESHQRLPAPIAIPAGRLLTPGDYTNEWFSH